MGYDLPLGLKNSLCVRSGYCNSYGRGETDKRVLVMFDPSERVLIFTLFFR